MNNEHVGPCSPETLATWALPQIRSKQVAGQQSMRSTGTCLESPVMSLAYTAAVLTKSFPIGRGSYLLPSLMLMPMPD